MTYQVTKWLDPNEMVKTVKGTITLREWCEDEVARIRGGGGFAYDDTRTEDGKDEIAVFRDDMDESDYMQYVRKLEK